jgi:hypothetical protein
MGARGIVGRRHDTLHGPRRKPGSLLVLRPTRGAAPLQRNGAVGEQPPSEAPPLRADQGVIGIGLGCLALAVEAARRRLHGRPAPLDRFAHSVGRGNGSGSRPRPPRSSCSTPGRRELAPVASTPAARTSSNLLDSSCPDRNDPRERRDRRGHGGAREAGTKGGDTEPQASCDRGCPAGTVRGRAPAAESRRGVPRDVDAAGRVGVDPSSQAPIGGAAEGRAGPPSRADGCVGPWATTAAFPSSDERGRSSEPASRAPLDDTSPPVVGR